MVSEFDLDHLKNETIGKVVLNLYQGLFMNRCKTATFQKKLSSGDLHHPDRNHIRLSKVSMVGKKWKIFLKCYRNFENGVFCGIIL